MHFNYIIHAHKNPKQVKRLIQTLTTQNSRFYLHIDKKVNIDTFLIELQGYDNVCFMQEEHRFDGTWGDIGIVKASIHCIKQILKEKRDGYILLLSGQDFPLKSKEHIETFLAQNYRTDYISYFPLPFATWSEQGGMERINQYKFNRSAEKYDFKLFHSFIDREFSLRDTWDKLRAFPRLKRIFILQKLFKKRRFPNYCVPYGGEHWWALTTETASLIMQFLKKHPDYLKYHTYSLCPDEIFFQSILMTLVERKGIRLKLEHTLTYVNWVREGVELPVTFTAADYDELVSQRKYLFVRKFDMDVDATILNKLEEKK